MLGSILEPAVFGNPNLSTSILAGPGLVTNGGFSMVIQPTRIWSLDYGEGVYGDVSKFMGTD